MRKTSLIVHTTLAVSIAFSLSACGGGGGGTKSDTSSAGGTIVGGGSASSVCENTKATNYGKSGACSFSYTNAADNQLYVSNAIIAQGEGVTGRGVKVGVLDSVPQNLTSYTSLNGKVVDITDAITKIGFDKASEKTDSFHGGVVASTVLGQSNGRFKGGVAPDAELYFGRVCFNRSCYVNATHIAVRDMTQKGVRLFNMSFAGLFSENGSEISDFKSIANEVMKVDGLVVAATGNDSTNEPLTPANLPKYYKEAENNWLAVANVRVNENGTPANLDTTSTRCGSSMNYCLVAPGIVVANDPQSTSGFSTYNGTSVSTPIVTGVSALVWSAYPWMSGSNVQQTVLTTATDLGASGVDAVYGWGLVNAVKAIHGPAQFTKDFSANVSGEYNSVFTNDISGIGGLTKTGAGSLTLTGNNTYSGLTSVNEGRLALKGRISSSLTNSATFYAVGGSIAGNYTALDGSVTGVQLGKTLTVGGVAALNGTLHVLNAENGYSVKSTEKLLSAGSVSGEFDQVTYANDLFWKADVAYSATEVSAAMSRTSAATAAVAFAMDQSVVDGAKQVDQVVAELDKRYENGGLSLDNVFNSSVAELMNASTNDAASTMSTLTGSVFGATRSASVASELGQLSSIADHIAASDSTERNVWVQAETTDGSVKRMGYATTNWDRDGVTVGVDMPLGQWSVGAVGNSSNLDLKSVADKVDTQQHSAYLWAHKDFGKAYTTAVAGATRSKVESVRTIATSVVETASSHRTDWSRQIRLETGYAFGSIAPFVAAGVVSSKQDGFRENNTSGWGLVAKSDTATIGFAEAGVRVSGDYGKWFYTGSAVYQNVFSGRSLNYVAAFGGLDEVGFDVVSPSVSKERFRAVLHGGYNLSPSVSVFGQITGETGSGQASRTAVELGARLAF